MKMLITFLMLLACSANAEIKASFSQSQEVIGRFDVTILVDGHDLEALHLFESMTVSPVINNSVISKQISFEYEIDPITSPKFTRKAFDVVCSQSLPSYPSYSTSCTLKLFGGGSVVNKKSGYAHAGVSSNSWATEQFKNFRAITSHETVSDTGSPLFTTETVFESNDGKLQIYKYWKNNGYNELAILFSN